MDQFRTKLFTMSRLSDVRALQDMGAVGEVIKPTLLSSMVIVVTGNDGNGVFSVRLGDKIYVRPVCPPTIKQDILEEVMASAAYTLYAHRDMAVDTTPIYAASEVTGV